MHCRINLDDEFVSDNVPSSWFRTDYQVFRKRLLYEKEVARLPEDQRTAALYMNAKKEIQAIDALPSHTMTKAQLHHKQQTRHYYLSVVKNYGISDSTSVKPKPKRVYVKACISSDCKGFLDEMFKCGLCSAAVCKHCHEGLGPGHEGLGPGHEGLGPGAHSCDAKTVESIKAIKAEARPCPSCSALISKIDGCDQMWCTLCHVTFSWRTGEKETGITHNPHFYMWARLNGGLARTPGDIPNNFCNNYPTLNDIYNLPYDHYNERLCEYHRYVHHNKATIIDRIPLFAEDNLDLRVRYLANELDKTRFCDLLCQRDSVYRRNLSKRSVHDMVYQAAGDLFRNYLSGQQGALTCEDFGKLFAYGNECLRRLEDRYGGRFGCFEL